jgi:hypothetical protein
MLRSKSLGCTIALLAIAGCGASPAAAPAAKAAPAPPVESATATPATAPVDVAAMARRELPPGPKQPLQAGAYSGQIEATAAPVVEVKPDLMTVTFSFGSEASVQCTIYAHEIDAASGLASILRAVAGEKLSIQHIVPYAAVAVGEDPALFVEASYLVRQPDGDAAGLLKVVAVDSPTAPMICFHDEMGYAGTFQRVITEFAASLRPANPPPPLKYVSLWSVRIGGMPVGFGRDVAGVDDQKRPFFATSGSLLVPTSANEVKAFDMDQREIEDGHGGVIEIRYASGDGTEAGMKSVVTKRTGAQEYTYEGTEPGGTRVSGKFKTKGPRGLRSEAERTTLLRDLVAGKPANGMAHFEQYSPDTSMTDSVDALYHLLAKDDRRVEEKTNGEVLWTGTVDDAGLTVNGELPGKLTLALERILVRGAP